jgi:hypothetical protein
VSTGSWRAGIAAADVVGSPKLGANGVMAVETQKQNVTPQELMVIDLAMAMLP